MTFDEALAHVQKCSTWETTKAMPQSRYVTIKATCYCMGIRYNREIILWVGVGDYRPEVIPALIYAEQRQLAHAIARNEEMLNA